MKLKRTPLIEYSASGPSLLGFTRTMPFMTPGPGCGMSPERAEEIRKAAQRRRDYMRRRACEAWEALVKAVCG